MKGKIEGHISIPVNDNLTISYNFTEEEDSIIDVEYISPHGPLMVMACKFFSEDVMTLVAQWRERFIALKFMEDAKCEARRKP